MNAGIASALASALLCAMSLTAETGNAASVLAATTVVKPSDPGAEQARFASLAGRWAVQESIWTSPDGAPVITPGEASLGLISGGRQLRQDLHIRSAAKDFVGFGLYGHDNLTGRFHSVWTDNTFTGLIIAYGAYDPAGKTYTFSGSINGATEDDPAIPLREVLSVLTDDHFTFEYFETRNGREARTVKLDYVRISP